MKKKGFVYIFSNTEHPGVLKIGKSKNNPVIRADQLTKQTGVIGTFILEWSKEVPDIDIAEIFLHYIFRKFHFGKEFFKISVQESKSIAETVLDDFFDIDSKIQIQCERIEIETSSNLDLRDLEKEFDELGAELKRI